MLRSYGDYEMIERGSHVEEEIPEHDREALGRFGIVEVESIAPRFLGPWVERLYDRVGTAFFEAGKSSLRSQKCFSARSIFRR
jgi:hypothetical protein